MNTKIWLSILIYERRKKRIMNSNKKLNLSQLIIKLNEKHTIIGKPVLVGGRI